MKQEDAIEILKKGFNVFLTGEPGSGKTHTINQYVAWLRERGIEPAVTASTGIAATHVGGVTIHSWSGIGVKRDINDWDIEMIQSREKTARRIIEAKVLIIDEVSMLDGATLASVDRVLRTLRQRTMQEEQAFGGLQVIFVGDFFQLPPVSRDGRAVFAFESNAWRDANPVVCYLSEQHRQEDADFLDLLNAMRTGEMHGAHIARLRERIGAAPPTEVATRLYTHNVDVDRINTESLSKIGEKVRVYSMDTRGAKKLVDTLKANCLSPEVLELKVGARVMFTRNNFDSGYVNGTLGTIHGFTELGLPIVRTKHADVVAEHTTWEIMDGSKVVARITQIPLRLAWAITVHKSQGMSLDAAIIDLSQAFEYGQGYVALSRVRSLGGLFLEGFNERSLEMHPRVVESDQGFRTRSRLASEKFQLLTAEERAAYERNFLRAIGAKEPSISAKVKDAIMSGAKKMSAAFSAERAEHKNAYQKWSAEDDADLARMFQEKKPIKDLSTHFGRKPGAIRSRLMHIGLLQNPFTSKKR